MTPSDSSVLFSSACEAWATPRAVYDALHAEFAFTFDPCPLMEPAQAGMSLFGTDGLYKPWDGHRVFCNPPYGPGIAKWLAKAREADLAVYLLPSRTDTRWWHDHAMHADEIRFLRRRLKFGGGDNRSTFSFRCAGLSRRSIGEGVMYIIPNFILW